MVISLHLCCSWIWLWKLRAFLFPGNIPLKYLSQLRVLSLEKSLPCICCVTWVSPSLSWESLLPTSLALHLATVFYLSAVRVFGPPSYSSAAYRTQWGAPHGGLWGSPFSGFSALILSRKLDGCTFWFFLDLCCMSSLVGNLSWPLCTPALCAAVSFHLGKVPGNESLLPLTSINISPYPFITEQLQSIWTAIGKLNLIQASTGGMKSDRKISWLMWKDQTHFPQYLISFYSKYSSENKLTYNPLHFLSRNLQPQKTHQLRLGNQRAFLALPVWQSLAAKSQPERRPNDYINK